MYTPRMAVRTIEKLEARKSPQTFLFGDKIKPVPPFMQSLVQVGSQYRILISHFSSNVKMWSEEANA